MIRASEVALWLYQPVGWWVQFSHFHRVLDIGIYIGTCNLVGKAVEHDIFWNNVKYSCNIPVLLVLSVVSVLLVFTVECTN